MGQQLLVTGSPINIKQPRQSRTASSSENLEEPTFCSVYKHGLSDRSLQINLHTGLKMQPYIIMLVQELSEENMKTALYCVWKFNMFPVSLYCVIQ